MEKTGIRVAGNFGHFIIKLETQASGKLLRVLLLDSGMLHMPARARAGMEKMRKSLDLARSGGVWGELAAMGVLEEERG